MNMMLTLENISDKEVQRNPENRAGIVDHKVLYKSSFPSLFLLLSSRIHGAGVGKYMSVWDFSGTMKYKLQYFHTS